MRCRLTFGHYYCRGWHFVWNQAYKSFAKHERPTQMLTKNIWFDGFLTSPASRAAIPNRVSNDVMRSVCCTTISIILKTQKLASSQRKTSHSIEARTEKQSNGFISVSSLKTVTNCSWYQTVFFRNEFTNFWSGKRFQLCKVRRAQHNPDTSLEDCLLPVILNVVQVDHLEFLVVQSDFYKSLIKRSLTYSMCNTVLTSCSWDVSIAMWSTRIFKKMGHGPKKGWDPPHKLNSLASACLAAMRFSLASK